MDNVSVCDTCRNPGRCCTGFSLGGATFPKGETMLDAMIALASCIIHDVHERAIVPPFLPLRRIDWERDGDPDHVWSLWCPLLVNGRCSDYENRPMLCKTYRPRQDGLCAMYEGIHHEWYEEQHDARRIQRPDEDAAAGVPTGG